MKRIKAWENKRFFKKLRSEQSIDLNDYAKGNYMTSGKVGIGVSKPMNPVFTKNFSSTPKIGIYDRESSNPGTKDSTN